MDELENMCYMKQAKKAKGHILQDSIYMKCPDQANPEAESRLIVTGGEEGD